MREVENIFTHKYNNIISLKTYEQNVNFPEKKGTDGKPWG